MARVSLDMNEIKKSVRATAVTAKNRISALAKQAQKDFNQAEILKRLDTVIEVVKSQEFMKNPKVMDLTARITALAEQVEDLVSKKAAPFVEQVRIRVSDVTKKSPQKAKRKAKKV